MLDAIGIAASSLMEVNVLLLILGAVIVGMVFGVLPGLSGVTAIAIMLPLTFGWDQATAMYFLIGIWGGPRKIYAAVKFVLFTMFGSLLMLLAIIKLYLMTSSVTGRR